MTAQAIAGTALRSTVLGAALAMAGAAPAAPQDSQAALRPAPASTSLLLRDGAAGAGTEAPPLELPDGETGAQALDALRRGRWGRACPVATAVLSRQVADADALGVFGLCAAVADDRQAAARALTRLREVEAPPYYGALVQAVLSLQDKAPQAAQATLGTVLAARPGDPLALYFQGEAWHARHHDAEAIAAFKGTLAAWPEFVPALSGSARLLAAANARPDALVQARTLAERATALEPMNRRHWQLLARLCERTGQHERASAIVLQRLQPPPAPPR